MLKIRMTNNEAVANQKRDRLGEEIDPPSDVDWQNSLTDGISMFMRSLTETVELFNGLVVGQFADFSLIDLSRFSGIGTVLDGVSHLLQLETDFIRFAFADILSSDIFRELLD